MTILVVDTDPDRLWELVGNIRSVFRNDTVEYTHDPLMGGRFGFNYPVDVLFAELEMKRMNGHHLSDLLRKQNPEMKTVLIFGQKEFCADASGWIAGSGSAGWNLVRPVTVKIIKEIADGLQPAARQAKQTMEFSSADVRQV